MRRNERQVCIGQKQVWFLLQFTGEESLKLDHTDTPEFDHWRWVDFWYPVEHVVMFKRGVYARALRHLAPLAQNLAGPAAVGVMPERALEAWLPGSSAAGHDSPRKRPRKRSGARTVRINND